MADALNVHEEQDAIARAKRGDCEAMERLIEAARPLIMTAQTCLDGIAEQTVPEME